VEERFLFDGVALHAGGVSPGDIKSAAAVVADFANPGLAFGNGTAVSAGKAADTLIGEFLIERRVGFADSLVEDVAQAGQSEPL